ncbi:MAG: hypothetical protein EOL95_00070 [Bacteroidia bacterium]|nr:hypothetical protein [Bacteroidia bacterium]
MLVVFTELYTPRVKYIFEQIFEKILHQEVVIINDKLALSSYSCPILCYSRTETIPNSFVVRPHGLLFGSGIKQYAPEVEDWNNTKIFFKTGNSDEDLPFDMFSAAFYLISRYEEYGSNELNKFGCYKAESSLAYKNGFLDEPIIDQWAYLLEDLLQQKNIGYEPAVKNRFVFRPLVNLDRLYKYRKRLLAITIYELVYKMLNSKWVSLKHQLKVLFFLADDPYFNIDYVIELHNRNNLVPTFFLLVKKRIKYDNQIFYTFYCSVRKLLRRNFLVEFHPSYSSFGSYTKMKTEKSFLESSVIRARATMSLFHLRMVLPQSYHNLLKLSIKEDYSMSYLNHIGFRASTCTPFNFYDISHEHTTKLVIHPLEISDRALKSMEVHHEMLAKLMKDYADKIKHVNGEMVTSFQNVSLSNDGNWYGWRGEYESAIRYISLLENHSIEESIDLSR